MDVESEDTDALARSTFSEVTIGSKQIVAFAAVARVVGSQLPLNWLIDQIMETPAELSGLTFCQLLCHRCTSEVMLWHFLGLL